MKKLSILGSTGSIGRSVLSVVDLYPDCFEVVALAARSRASVLYEQCLKYRPRLVALHDSQAAQILQGRIPMIQVQAGLKGLIEVAQHPDADLVIAAITGAAGLIPTYQAIVARKHVALANKEVLVMAGPLIMSLAKHNQVKLLPLDSEHAALHQCLRGSQSSEVRRLLLTASGGPFFRKSKQHLDSVRAEEALNHPTWKMGPKITIDSATLMNKGLELIEAHYLFDIDPDQISIVVHPQSSIHSMVEFIDGTVLAQLSIIDMRSVILYALAHPERWESHLPSLDFFSLPALEFYPPDSDRFPCLRLARESLRKGQTYPAVLNAANEVAVQDFLQGKIPFPAIPEIIEEVLNKHSPSSVQDIGDVLAVDHDSREAARGAIEALVG